MVAWLPASKGRATALAPASSRRVATEVSGVAPKATATVRRRAATRQDSGPRPGATGRPVTCPMAEDMLRHPRLQRQPAIPATQVVTTCTSRELATNHRLLRQRTLAEETTAALIAAVAGTLRGEIAMLAGTAAGTVAGMVVAMVAGDMTAAGAVTEDLTEALTEEGEETVAEEISTDQVAIGVVTGAAAGTTTEDETSTVGIEAEALRSVGVTEEERAQRAATMVERGMVRLSAWRRRISAEYIPARACQLLA